MQQKGKKRRKRKGKKSSKICACPSRNVVKRDVSGTKAILSCYKCRF